jgi:hypothetical protein
MGAGIGGSALRVHLLVDGAEWAPRVLPDSSLEWIVPVRAGARIEAQRTSLNIFKQSCPYDPSEPCTPPLYAYDLRPVGLAGVHVEGVVPLQVLPPGAAAGDTALVAPGREATFTIQAVDGMTAPVWYFFAWEGSLTRLRDCSGQMSCTIIPPKRGSVIVYGKWNGYTFESEYLHIKTVPAQLQLKCNGAQDSVRITRADELTCNVSGATDITGWEFSADTYGYHNPAAGGTPFTGIEWKGRVVLSGTVTVNARVGGAVESKSVRVSVEARDWGGMTMPRSISEEPALHLPPRPDSLHHLGDIHHLMVVEFQHMENWAAIFTGPNANLAYLVKPPAEYEATVHVNRAALSRDSDFWNAQYTRQRSSGIVDCLQREADITDFIPVILQHEGVGFDPKSHAYLYVTTADRVGNPRYERVVGSTLQELADQATAVHAMAHDSAVAASARADSSGYAPTWCRFHFNYGGR